MEELCAVWGCDISNANPEDIERAQKLIDRNVLRMKVLLKNALYKQNNRKSMETLFKLIGDDAEAQRLGSAKTTITNNNNSPVIEIKSADPDVVEQLKDL